MARTRSQDYDQIQAEILDRAADLFATRGYAGISIGDIAKACQCSKSRLYHYFSSKENILSAMLADHIEMLLEGGRALAESHPDPIERFRAVVHFFMEVYVVSRSKHVVQLTCMEFLPTSLRQEIFVKERELISLVRVMLAAIRPDSADRVSPIAVDKMLVFGMINWTYTWYHAEGSVTPNQLADRALSLFLDGYRSADAASAPGADGSPQQRAKVDVAP